MTPVVVSSEAPSTHGALVSLLTLWGVHILLVLFEVRAVEKMTAYVAGI